MTPAELLQALMDRADENPNSLSARTKVPQPTIFRFLSGTAKEPRVRTLAPLAAHYGIPVEAFLNERVRRQVVDQLLRPGAEAARPYEDAQVKSSKVAVAGIAQLGENGWYEEVQTLGADGFVEAHSSDVDAYALRVKGDSMFPAIRNGWYVVVEPNKEPVAGEYVAVELRDGRKMVKEFLFRNSESVTVQSVNGGTRHTLGITEVQNVHHIGAILMPSKHLVL